MIYLVSGSREFSHQAFVTSTIHHLLTPADTLMHGTARGVDQWCAQAAFASGAQVLARPADWTRYGRSAGHRRNEEMIQECLELWGRDHLRILIFWNGTSPGTKNFLDHIHHHRLSYQLFFPPTP